MSEDQELFDRIRTRACGIVVDRAAHHLLLVKVNVPTRSESIWMPPGGELHHGEWLQQAAQREVREETGLRVEVGKLLSIHEFMSNSIHALEYYFHAVYPYKINVGELPVSQSADPRVEAIAWVSQKDFTNYPVEPSYLKKHILSLMNSNADHSIWPVHHKTNEY